MTEGVKLNSEFTKVYSWDESCCAYASFRNWTRVCSYFLQKKNDDEETYEFYMQSQFKLNKVFEGMLKFYLTTVKLFDLINPFPFTKFQELLFDYLKKFEIEDLENTIEKKNNYAAVIARDVKKLIAAHGFEFELETLDEFLDERKELINDIDISFFKEDTGLIEAMGFIMQGLFMVGVFRAAGEDLSTFFYSNDAVKLILNYRNVTKFLELCNQFVVRLHGTIPIKQSQEKHFLYFYGKLMDILAQLKTNGGIEDAPPNLDEEILRFGINLYNFIVKNTEAGGLEFKTSAVGLFIEETLFMLAIKKQTSDRFADLYLTYLETLGKIYNTKNGNYYLRSNALFDCLEFVLRTSSADLLGATLELVVKSSFYKRNGGQVEESIDLRFSGFQDIKYYYPTSPTMLVGTILDSCEIFKEEEGSEKLRLKLKHGQDISKLQLTQSQIKSLEFPRRIMDYLIRSFYNKLNEVISSWAGRPEFSATENFKCYLLSSDFYLKAIAMLCSKYPLLIPIVEEHEISIEELEKSLGIPWFLDFVRCANPGTEKISLPEYVLLTINFHKNLSWPFFLSLSERPFCFIKEESGKLVSSSKMQQAKYLARLRRELLRTCEPGFFKSCLKVERFREYINLYSKILFQFPQSPDLEWEKNEIIKTLKTFNYMAEHFAHQDSELILWSKFYNLFRYVYKYYMKLLFTEKTGKKYDKDLEAVKYYLNKRLNKSFLAQKSAELLKKAEQNSLNLKEPIDYLTEEPKLKDKAERNIDNSIAAAIDLTTHEDLIQSNEPLSIKDYDIYANILKKDTPALEKNGGYGKGNFYSYMMNLYKKGLMSCESPKKLESESYGNPIFQVEYCYGHQYLNGFKEAPEIDIILREMYSRMRSKNEEETNSFEEKQLEDGIKKELEETMTKKVEEKTELVEENAVEEKKNNDDDNEAKVTENTSAFNLEEYGYKPDCLKSYSIDESLFYSLPLADQLEALQKAKDQLKNSEIEYDFLGNGYPTNALELYMIEKSFFDALPCEMREEVLQEAKMKYDEQQGSLMANSRVLKKLLYKNLREKMTVGRILSNDSHFLDNPADVEQIALYIKQLDSTDRNQLYHLMTRDFQDILPAEIKSAILAEAPIAYTGLLYEPCLTYEVESNYSDEERYIQDEAFVPAEESLAKARNFLFTSFPFSKKVKSILDNDDFFLEIPMITDKALLNTLRIFSKPDVIFEAANCEDIGFFLRDIQFNPVNATRIVDYIFFAFSDTLSKLKHDEIYQPIDPLNYKQIISKKEWNDVRISNLEISNNMLDRFSFLISKFLAGGRSVPLIINSLYNEQRGLIFAENQDIPKLSQIIDLRSSCNNSGSLSLLEMIFNICATIQQKIASSPNTEPSNAIISILNKQITLPEGSSKRMKHPLIRLVNPNPLKNLTNSIIKNLSKEGKVIRGKKALHASDSTFVLLQQILKLDSNLFSELFGSCVAYFLGDLSEDVEKTLEQLNELKKTFDPSASREEIAEKIMQDVLSSKEFNKKAQIFRLIMRDSINLFNSLFENYKSQKYSIDYNDWAVNNPDVPEKELKEFNLNFKKKMSNEKLHQISILKNLLLSNENLICFFKSSVESVLFLNSLLNGINEEEYDENIRSLISYYSFGIKALIIIHDFLNPAPDGEEDCQKSVLAKLMTKEALEPEPKINTARLARAYTQINNENIGISDLYGILLNKSCSFVVNLILRAGRRLSKYEPTLLLIPNPVKINFEIKADFLAELIKNRALAAGFNSDDEDLNPDRTELVHYAIQKFMSLSPLEFAMKSFSVTFQNESGIDAGGLTREFFTILVEDLVNPDFGLFEYASGRNTLQPSRLSHWVPDHLTYFKFLGRLIGKCIADKKPLKLHFTKSFLKHILGRTLYIKDIEDLDPIMYKNLEWILENPVGEVLNLTFSTEVIEFGNVLVKDLLPDGRNIIVTESNKKEYLKRLSYFRLAESISKQTAALVEGLREIVPFNILKLLDEKELSLLISGMPHIDVEDLWANAEINLEDTSKMAEWIWEVLQNLSQKQLADFLFFVTGSTVVPLGGFKNFKIKFNQSYSNPESLPIGHTCYMQIDFPQYQTKEKLKEKLLLAINEGTGGFYIS